ncbi:MAG: integrase arm-type DNA-binding domain-containing protein, partial [Psychromonas sp.]
MARTNPLTNTEVKQAKPILKDGKLKAKKLSDGDGLQLKIATNSTKSWILNFKCPYTKKMTSMSFGLYPAISLSEARKLRQSARELLAKGLNPKHEKDLKSQLEDEA